MLIFKTFATGSTGNFYTLTDGYTRILIECGLPENQIKKFLDYDYKYDCCLISHEHKDHSKSAYWCSKFVPTFCTTGTKKKIKNNEMIIAQDYKKPFTVKTLKITFFETQHDSEQPAGFLIESLKTKERFLFATDTYFIKYKFKDIDYYAVECNYNKDILEQNFEEGKIEKFVKDRLLKSHFSLENLIKYFEKVDLKRTKKIYLLHLSSMNSDEIMMKESIEKKFFIETEIQKGEIYE